MNKAFPNNALVTFLKESLLYCRNTVNKTMILPIKSSNRGRIKLKLKYFIILLILSVLLSACNTAIKPKEHVGEIYSVALDTIMERNQALNRNMEYIAIDMSNFEDVDKGDKEEILSYFREKYKVEVMDSTFEQLEAKGLYNPDTLSLDGVLLSIEKFDFKFNKEILFEGSKHRSGLGAFGIEGKVHYKNSKWKPKEVKMTWIS